MKIRTISLAVAALFAMGIMAGPTMNAAWATDAKKEVKTDCKDGKDSKGQPCTEKKDEKKHAK